jgi:hypothetical protein
MTNLVSRIACFGRLKHRAVGYSGPLDRQLLSYSYMITAVRSSLRDLIETILVAMFLSYDAERDREDYSDLIAAFVMQPLLILSQTDELIVFPFSTTTVAASGLQHVHTLTRSTKTERSQRTNSRARSKHRKILIPGFSLCPISQRTWTTPSNYGMR